VGIRYGGERQLEAEEYAGAIVPVLAPTGLEVHIEPGRFLVGPAGVLLATVLYRKHSGGKDFVVLDAGMTELGRPSRYGAYHEILPLPARAGPEAPCDIVGPVCETGDFLALDRPVPADLRAGDVVAILGAGAYGFVMGSTYNGRPRPPEVLVDGARWGIARRRETLDELLLGEVAEPLPGA
jgi:diaminopimelate decarboxylase